MSFDNMLLREAYYVLDEGTRCISIFKDYLHCDAWEKLVIITVGSILENA